jgi:hypothetical protein
MNALGVIHLASFVSGGLGWVYFDRMSEEAFRFVLAGLETESRRLL